MNQGLSTRCPDIAVAVMRVDMAAGTTRTRARLRDSIESIRSKRETR